MTHVLYARIAATIFLLVFVLHMLRIIYGWEVQIESVRVPMWISWFGILIAGFLSAYGFRFASQK